jgi:catechol 2,3-dioxygenase-like lactoylglutathione lyase family enzyme
METPGLNHIILTVSDVPKARWFYGELLGLELHNLQDGFYFDCGGVEFSRRQARKH